jgi:cell division septum initiation protein DivIVA
MKELDKLIISTKIVALLELKNKIQEEIDELERQKAGEDEIPF